MRKNYLIIFLCTCIYAQVFAQCPDCGNGIIDPGENHLNCPADVLGVDRGASCVATCSPPAGKDPAFGLRLTGIDFNTTQTAYYSPASATQASLPQSLPTGWSFGGASSATSTTTVPASDAFGSQTGVVRPTGCCSNGQNGFVTASFTSAFLGSGGCSGLLGANFDGQPNVSSNPAFAVLRGGTNFTKPTLVSPSYNNASVEVFKIQFFMGAGGSWNCGGSNPRVYLDFSSNGGSTWTEIMMMNTATSTDMCSGATTNTSWFTQGSWSRVCLTVFRSPASENHPAGNYYANAAANTAPSGIMVDSRWFTSNFRYRLRLVGSTLCSGITGASTSSFTKPPGNPGRYVYIDYPVYTSGNQCIPCGLSFVNMCGFGDDANDDGVGSEALSTSPVPLGTLRRGVNMAEKGAEIFTLNGTSLTGSTFTFNDIPCDAEGGDKQCMTNNGLALLFLVTQDYEPSGSCATASIPTLNYYRLNSHGASSATAASIRMTPVTTTGRANSIGWRSRATVFLNCNSTFNDTYGACQGYLFSLPTSTKQPRGFYNLFINNTTGRATSLYGAASSCRGYFAGPVVAPLSEIDLSDPNSIQGTACNASEELVFTAQAQLCGGASPQGMEIEVRGPLPSTNLHSAYTVGNEGLNPITVPGDYIISSQPANTDSRTWDCIDCKRRACVNITQAMIDNCVLLNLDELDFRAELLPQKQALLSWNFDRSKYGNTIVLERSSNGIDFWPLASLPLSTPEFRDRKPLAGSNYYRLALEPRNKTAAKKYSKLGVLYIEKQEAALLTWQMRDGSLESTIYFPKEEELYYRLLDLSGRSLLQGRSLMQAGTNSFRLDLHELPPGSYILDMRSPSLQVARGCIR